MFAFSHVVYWFFTQRGFPPLWKHLQTQQSWDTNSPELLSARTEGLVTTKESLHRGISCATASPSSSEHWGFFFPCFLLSELSCHVVMVHPANDTPCFSKKLKDFDQISFFFRHWGVDSLQLAWNRIARAVGRDLMRIIQANHPSQQLGAGITEQYHNTARQDHPTERISERGNAPRALT